MEDVTAAETNTLVIRWRSLYPDAAALRAKELDPLPSHVLGTALAAFEHNPAGQKDAFANHPYWSSQYVGLGPYRLDRWEPASELEGLAFDAHALGRPKIDRLIVRLISDENAALANLLAENIDVALALRFEHGTILRHNWAESRRGLVLLLPGSNNTALVQFRPEFLKVAELADLRVRRALGHAIDRDALNDGLFEGEGLMGETFIVPTMSYYPELDRRLRKYPHDLRRTEQLMAEAGVAKGADGFYLERDGERMILPYLVLGGGEKSMAIMTDVWRQAGFDIQPMVLPVAQTSDAQARATFPALANTNATATERVVQYFASTQIGSAANRWGGNNRGGWSHPEYDRLFDVYRSTLDGAERQNRVIEMMATVSDQLPGFKLFFNVDVLGYLSTVRGPQVGTPESLALWNVHEWEID
jgi:peptide/nickel transport system substrate-binding protein